MVQTNYSKLGNNYNNTGNIIVIKSSKYIHTQSDLNGCTNHYSKEVYYKIVLECSEIINKFIDIHSKAKISISVKWFVIKIINKIREFLIKRIVIKL